MALPSLIAKHVHISERESIHVWPDGRKDDGAWEDCAWVALIEFLRLAYRPDLPTTHTFMESIRARVMGPLGGTVPSQLVAGAKTIGVTGPKTAGIVLKGVSAGNLWAAMPVGTVACVAGSMGAFPVGYTLRRWDPGFAGGHEVLAVRVDAADRVWWCDPLAPTGTGYEGQWVSKADFLKFAAKLNSTSFVAPVKVSAVPAPTPDPVPPVVYTPAQLNDAVAAAIASTKAADATAQKAAVEAETTRATAAERARIRAILGI